MQSKRSDENKRPSLVEAAKSVPRRQSRATWFDQLDENWRSQLTQLKTAWHGMELPPHVTVSQLHRLVCEQVPVSLARDTFRRWLLGE